MTMAKPQAQDCLRFPVPASRISDPIVFQANLCRVRKKKAGVSSRTPKRLRRPSGTRFLSTSVLLSSPINAICDDSFFASLRIPSRFLDFSLVAATLRQDGILVYFASLGLGGFVACLPSPMGWAKTFRPVRPFFTAYETRARENENILLSPLPLPLFLRLTATIYCSCLSCLPAPNPVPLRRLFLSQFSPFAAGINSASSRLTDR